METVEVVIRIPEEWIEQFKAFKHPSTLETIILQGTVLPKGHGDLKDYDAIKSEYFRKMSVTMSTEFRMKLLCGIIDDAPTVIEADREVEDEGSGV